MRQVNGYNVESGSYYHVTGLNYMVFRDPNHGDELGKYFRLSKVEVEVDGDSMLSYLNRYTELWAAALAAKKDALQTGEITDPHYDVDMDAGGTYYSITDLPYVVMESGAAPMRLYRVYGRVNGTLILRMEEGTYWTLSDAVSAAAWADNVDRIARQGYTA